MCLHVDPSSFLLFKVASLGLYNIKYFYQVDNVHCLPTDGMFFFQYTPLYVVCDVTVLQLPYLFTELVVLLLLSCLKVG